MDPPSATSRSLRDDRAAPWIDYRYVGRKMNYDGGECNRGQAFMAGSQISITFSNIFHIADVARLRLVLADWHPNGQAKTLLRRARHPALRSQ
jgi:hypothetical protein